MVTNLWQVYNFCHPMKGAWGSINNNSNNNNNKNLAAVIAEALNCNVVITTNKGAAVGNASNTAVYGMCHSGLFIEHFGTILALKLNILAFRFCLETDKKPQ